MEGQSAGRLRNVSRTEDHRAWQKDIKSLHRAQLESRHEFGISGVFEGLLMMLHLKERRGSLLATVIFDSGFKPFRLLTASFCRARCTVSCLHVVMKISLPSYIE